MTRKEIMIAKFTEAKEEGAKFIFTEIDLGIGYEANEIIINPIANVDVKLEYLCNTYDENLNHPHAPVSIVSFGYLYNVGQLEYAVENGGK